MVAVTVMVSMMAEEVGFVALKAGITPEFPVNGRPIVAFLFIHEKVVPAGSLVKLIGPMVSPLHTVILSGTVILGVGLIIIGVVLIVVPQLLVTDSAIVSLPAVLNRIFPGLAAADHAGVPWGKDHV